MSELAGAALLAFAPFCLACGAFLAMAAGEGDPADEAGRTGRVYALDCLGGVLGGATFTFLLVHLFRPVPLLAAMGAAVGVMAIFIGLEKAPKKRIVGQISARDAPPTLESSDSLWEARLAPNRRPHWAGAAPGLLAVVACALAAGWPREPAGKERHDTPYGVVEIDASGGQVAVFMDGRPLSTSAGVEQAEESTHPVLAQRLGAGSVLLVGGSTSGMVKEILRYPVRALDCVELDPALGDAAAAHGFLPLLDPRVRVRIGDGREAVKGARGEYDAILVEVPDPENFQWNRYFTREFFAQAKRALRAGGVFAIAAGRYDNYVGPELARVIGTVSSDLGGAFAHVVVLPTARIRFVASDGPVSADVPAVVAATGLSLRHLNPEGLRAVFREERMAQVQGARATSSRPNRDFHPVLCEEFLRDWLRRFRPVPSGLALAAAAALLVGVAMVRRAGLPVFAAGYAGATAQVLVLVGFQALFGSVYGKMGWLAALLFGGLGAGAYLGARARGVTARGALLLLALALLALPPWLAGLGKLDGALGRFAAEWIGIPVLAAVPAALAGAVLPLSARGGVRAGDLYHADFAGGCLGALLVSGLWLPRAGLAGAASAAAGMVLVGALLATGRGSSGE
jgi:spermidine synthase